MMKRTLVLSVALLFVAGLSSPGAAETIRIGGTGSAMRAMEILGESFHKSDPGATVTIVPGLGGRGGLKALQAGAVDLAVSPAHVTEPGLVSLELGRTAFVFGVPRAVTVTGLSLDELVQIYAGRMTAWRDGARLRLILRPKNDSDIASLRAISPAMNQAVDESFARPGIKIAPTDQMPPMPSSRHRGPSGPPRFCSSTPRAARSSPWRSTA
jgi:phosphate transport system substrate-binding protein